MDCQFIRRCLGFHPVYQLVRRLHRRLLSRYRQFIRQCPFYFVSFLFYPWKIEYLLNLAFSILASLGPRNVYKDMLNNMVSPVDNFVMNHQNQTWTNGKWGHVHYIGMQGGNGPKSCQELYGLTTQLLLEPQISHPSNCCTEKKLLYLKRSNWVHWE
jgi:hypothetical protein